MILVLRTKTHWRCLTVASSYAGVVKPLLTLIVVLPLIAGTLCSPVQRPQVNSEFVFDLQLSSNGSVILNGSSVDLMCSCKAPNSWELLATVGLLFAPTQASKSAIVSTQTWRNSSAVVFHLAKVEIQQHSGWYRCGLVNSLGEPIGLSRATLLAVGSKPSLRGVEFYWQDRMKAHLSVIPSLDEIANRTGVPIKLGGKVSLSVGVIDLVPAAFDNHVDIVRLDEICPNCQSKLTVSPLSQSRGRATDCSCECDSYGQCNLGKIEQSFIAGADIVLLHLRVCNRIGWCTDSTVEFDIRDKEKPNPVRRLSVSFEAHLLDISWKLPTTEIPGNQEYSYQVSLSDGRCLATNATRLSLPAKPDTGYSVTVRCRPKFFAGHWSDNSSVAGRSAEWLPCNPRAGEAFLVPPDVLVFPASDRSCRNGRIQSYELVNLDTNKSQLVPRSRYDLQTADFIKINISDLIIEPNQTLRLAVLASTSVGKNSSSLSNPHDVITVGPVGKACKENGNDRQFHRVVICNNTAKSLEEFRNCRQLSARSVGHESTTIGRIIRDGVLCSLHLEPASSVDSERKIYFSFLIAPILLAFIVLGIYLHFRRTKKLPPAKNYGNKEPDDDIDCAVLAPLNQCSSNVSSSGGSCSQSNSSAGHYTCHHQSLVKPLTIVEKPNANFIVDDDYLSRSCVS